MKYSKVIILNDIYVFLRIIVYSFWENSDKLYEN